MTTEPYTDPLLTALIEIRDIHVPATDDDFMDSLNLELQKNEKFEDVLYAPLGHGGLGFCGCGIPESSLKMIVAGLEYCAITHEKGSTAREDFLFENFQVKHVSDNGVTQMFFYMLDSAGLISHNFTLNGSTLTESGELMMALAKDYLASEYGR